MRIAILLALLASTAHADDNEITITESVRALRTRSANAITDDSLVGGSLGYARALPATLGPFALWAHASFDWAVTSGTMFQTLTTDLYTLGGSAGIRARYHLWRDRIVASARADLGFVRAALEIRDDAGHAVRDSGWGATTSVGGGVDLVVVRSRRFTMALRTELAAVATSSIPLSATPARDGGNTLQLEMTAASLGSLNLSGPAFAVSLVGRF
jgi:hypothetical protein